jgi:hypothetical protein
MSAQLKAPSHGSRGPKGLPRMLKAVSISRTYDNLPAYEVLKISDYNHAEARCRNKQKMLSKRRQHLEDDDDKENFRVAMQSSRQRKEKERAPVGTVVIHSPSTMSQISTQGSVVFPLPLSREKMDSASSKSNTSATASDSSKCTASTTSSASERFMTSDASKINALTTASASLKSNALTTARASLKSNASATASASLKSTASMTASASSARPSSTRNQLSSKSRCTPKQMQAFEKEKRQVFMVKNEAYALGT